MQNASSHPPVEIYGKFSPGGMRLTITGKPYGLIIVQLGITYCDGSSETFGHNVVTNYTHLADKPMERVNIVFVNPYGIDDNEPLLSKVVKRNCELPDPLPSLYCNDVKVARAVQRSWKEPISFKSTRFVYLAGLKLSGVDGPIWIKKVEWNHGIGWNRTLSYKYSEKVWTGTFPSTEIPVGKYNNVWLIVIDDYGQQAKCRIGDLEILP